MRSVYEGSVARQPTPVEMPLDDDDDDDDDDESDLLQCSVRR
jgi:hypothetical protein